MGAVTALMHVDRDPSLAAICLDSPFSSLRELIEEIAQSERLYVPVPTWLVNGILSVIRMRVKALADFDIEDLVPLNHGPKSNVPALFLHGLQDTFVLPRHSEKLYNNYSGDKEMMMFEGDHNTERSERVIDRGVGFLCRAFRKYELELSMSQQIADVHFSVPAQDGQPHRIPHLPRGSIQRKAKANALGDITNVPQGPGARANEVEAAMAQKSISRATSVDTENVYIDDANKTVGRRPAPRKFASSHASRRSATPPRQPMKITAETRALGSPVDGAEPDSKLLTNRVYQTNTKAPGADLENGGSTPRGDDSNSSRRSRSKGPTDRNGFSIRSLASAARFGGA